MTRRTRLTVDDFGNAYVTGTAFHTATANDALTVKYDSSGNRLWSVHYAAPGLSVDSGSAVAVDSHGDVHVAGETTALIGQGTDLLVLRYRQQDFSGAFRIDLVRQIDGSFRLSMPSGTNFAVEASTDLIHWSPASEEETGGQIQLPTLNPQRFYRLVRPWDQ